MTQIFKTSKVDLAAKKINDIDNTLLVGYPTSATPYPCSTPVFPSYGKSIQPSDQIAT
ncbi:hypothetical protein [Serratia fonticola]|uniref:hypothetical protein n=1 Tax=Serratia fonticola TaxID=47917 RepID=UPI0004149E7A|nr:hypothetical protein [Serratia fonticola]CAI0744992.1 Uncharacterised protein [Serratia fonticola]